MRCPKKSIIKQKYISIVIKKLYLMFFKYKQTQSRCAKNEYAIPRTRLQIVEIKHCRNRHSMFISVILFIIVQLHLYFSNDFHYDMGAWGYFMGY